MKEFGDFNHETISIWRGNKIPAGAPQGQFFRHTSRNITYEYRYVRELGKSLWLSEHPIIISMAIRDAFMPRSATTASAVAAVPPWVPTYDIFLESLEWSAYAGVPQSGTQYWNVELFKTVNVTSTSIVTSTTNGDTADQWQKHQVSINSLLGTDAEELDITLTRVSTAGVIYFVASVIGRLVG